MENPKRHIMITGAVGAGKSTLICRLLRACALSVRGFRTWASVRDESGFRDFFLSPVGEADPSGTKENRIGRSDGQTKVAFPEVFDRLGPPLLTARQGDVLVMDELGSMEESASIFCKAVTACLDGNVPVLGAVKLRGNLPFLTAVKNHPKVSLYVIDESNRDAVYKQLLPLILSWNAEG